MSRPNYFIIGAPRCGTSSLYDGVSQHPEIFMSPVKEPCYFSIGLRTKPFQGPRDAYYNHYLNREEYERLFSSVSGKKIIGEASTDYLYCESALNALRHEFPNAKLMALLRNPAERAFSHYFQHVAQGREPCRSFWKAIELEDERMRLNWCHYWFYRDLGFYGRQLARYFEYFDKQQIKVMLLEDLQSDPERVYRELFAFLDVDCSFIPSDTKEKHNAGFMPSNSYLQNFITKPSVVRSVLHLTVPRRIRAAGLRLVLARRKKTKPPGINPDDRRRLIKDYREDVELLESLIDRSLSHWLDCLEEPSGNE